jgi:hypothetical protein
MVIIWQLFEGNLRIHFWNDVAGLRLLYRVKAAWWLLPSPELLNPVSLA